MQKNFGIALYLTYRSEFFCKCHNVFEAVFSCRLNWASIGCVRTSIYVQCGQTPFNAIVSNQKPVVIYRVCSPTYENFPPRISFFFEFDSNGFDCAPPWIFVNIQLKLWFTFHIPGVKSNDTIVAVCLFITQGLCCTVSGHDSNRTSFIWHRPDEMKRIDEILCHEWMFFYRNWMKSYLNRHREWEEARGIWIKIAHQKGDSNNIRWIESVFVSLNDVKNI